MNHRSKEKNYEFKKSLRNSASYYAISYFYTDYITINILIFKFYVIRDRH